MALKVVGTAGAVPVVAEGWVEMTEIGVLCSQLPTAAVVGKSLARESSAMCACSAPSPVSPDGRSPDDPPPTMSNDAPPRPGPDQLSASR